jgi:endoglucanase
MHKKIAKAVAASLMATTLLSTTVATVVPMSVSAGEILGENTFEYKALPWHTCETNPAKQTFKLDNGTFHVTVVEPGGEAKGGESRWDLQFRCRNLNFRAGHTYKIHWEVKGSRPGIQINSKIGNIEGDKEYWNNNAAGPHGGGTWNPIITLNSTDWQKFDSTWTCPEEHEGAEWAFHYGGAGPNQSTNCTEAGDELWFDNMSIIDETSNIDDADPNNHYGAMNRDFSGLKNNFISVNQVGYYTNLEKVATLGDNTGDILHGATKIDIGSSPLDFEVVNASTGAAAYTGKTQPVSGKDKDSGDNVHKIDFTEFDQPGRYYIKVGEWRSFEFNIGDNIYLDSSHNMLTNALNYFYQNRSGIDIKSEYITSGNTTTLAHEGGHKTDTATVQKEWVKSYKTADEATGTYASSKITATGGWYDAGDHGKYVVNGGISVWTLQNMYERALQTEKGAAKFAASNTDTMKVPESGNSNPDILEEAAVELDWMKDMIVKSDEPTWGQYAGLVYHKLHDHKWTGLATRPWNYETEWKTVRIVKPPTYAATLNFVACAAQASRLWQSFDSTKAAEYLTLAKTSYEAFKKNFKEYSSSDATDPKSLYAPLDQAIGGGAYGDTEVKDDAYWAACELFATTGDKEYYDDLSKWSDAFKVTTRVSGGENDATFTTFNWGNTASAGTLSLFLNEDNSKLSLLTDSNKSTINDSILAAAQDYIDMEDKQGYGIPYTYDGAGYSDPVNLPPDVVIKGYEWGSNSMVINNAIVMAYAYDQTKDVKYMNGVATAMDYLLGRNPLSVSYVTGYGSYHTAKPHHRYWSNELDKSLPMAPDGVLSGGPNAGLQDPYVRALGFEPGNADNASQRCYVDSIEAWSTNEVTINWNSPLAWIVSFLQDEAPDASGTTDPTKKTVTVTPSSVTVEEGKTSKIDVKVNGAAASATFESSDTSVATVAADGTVTGVKAGSATIKVTAEGQTKNVTVTVTGSGSESDPTGSSGETVPSYEGDDLLYGDVDLNGEVALGDVTKLGKYLINKNSYPVGNGTPDTVAKALTQANVKYDDAVDGLDLSKLIEFNLKKISQDELGPKR